MFFFCFFCVIGLIIANVFVYACKRSVQLVSSFKMQKIDDLYAVAISTHFGYGLFGQKLFLIEIIEKNEEQNGNDNIHSKSGFCNRATSQRRCHGCMQEDQYELDLFKEKIQLLTLKQINRKQNNR